METPCLALNNMAELPRLLRRPLPPKILPAIIKETSTPIKQDLFVDKRPSTPCVSRINSGKGKVHSHDQAEHKYPLNDQTQYGVFMNHRGPEDFPSRRQFKKPLANVLPLISDDPRYQPPPPEFALGDITAHASHRSTMQIDLLDQPVVSQHHYTNMELLIYKLQNRPQSKIHSVLLSAKEIPKMSKRIPYPQLLLEHRKQNLTEGEEHLIYTGEDTLHPLLKSQYLQCSEVAHSAKGHDQNKVLETYCELAILESLIHGGKSLSLKAYFIYKLPDLMPLHETLSYLNLSFNDFRLFPTEVYMLENLEVLKLRNNPINEIPYGIHNLRKLRTLIMSFCLLSSLPAGLFLLRNLQTLDVSYNSICSIPKDIGNLRLLEFLNVEGNSLPALPCEALKLKLKYLRVANNEMHPLFWRENTCVKPQKLTDLAALSFAKNNMWHHVKKIPNDVKKILDNVNVCDCCTGPLYGQGLFFIRPCEKIFGIRKLPFMFQACSPSCYKNFMCQRESLTEHLYGC